MRHNDQLWYEAIFGVDYVDTLDAPSIASSSEDDFSRYKEAYSEFEAESSEEEEYEYSDSSAYKSARSDISGFGFDILSNDSDSDAYSLMSREQYIDDYTHDLLYDPDFHPEDGEEFAEFAIVPYLLPLPIAWFIFPLDIFDGPSPAFLCTARGSIFGIARVADMVFLLVLLPPTSYRGWMMILVVWSLQF